MSRIDGNKISKKISYILRHNPYPLYMDENGWVSVQKLLSYLDIIKWDLDYIVETNNKKRFSYNDTETLIRANQGHSLKVDVELEEKNPPDVLYHGTSINKKELIFNSGGLNKMNRNHVHLSADINIAKKVGQRHGKLLLLKINSQEMYENGIKFYLSKNNVWLTDFVDRKYIVTF